MPNQSRIEELKHIVFEGNLALVKHNLIKLTWGNVSAIDRDLGVIVIKPSGVAYDAMRQEDMVLTDLDGNPLEEGMKPSSDLDTHVYLYKKFDKVNSIVHTHSKWAVVWASVAHDVPILNTTHADAFYGSIPCARDLSDAEVEGKYELNTGVVIEETFKKRNINYLEVPGIITAHHGPFTWGTSVSKAVENSIILEEVSDIAYHAIQMEPNSEIPEAVKEKHYLRKHGKNAYYGQ